MIVLLATTCAPYKACRHEELAWLDNAEAIRDSVSGIELHFGAVLETDGRGLAPYEALLNRLADLELPRDLPEPMTEPAPTVHQWEFSIDTGATAYGSDERLARICTGRNLITEMAVRLGAEWVLFADSDARIPGDVLPKLFEVCWPIVGGDLPAYCLDGPTVKAPDGLPAGASEKWRKRLLTFLEFNPGGYDFPVKAHWNTAACLLVHRDLFTQLRWRTDPERGMTDDPCYALDAERLGWVPLTRHDLGIEHVVALVGVEARGYDLEIRP